MSKARDVYAFAHFKRLNEWLVKENIPIKYQFNFLTPKDYNKFFQQMRNNKLVEFRSGLDVAMTNVIPGN